jgi:hypothetical protein
MQVNRIKSSFGHYQGVHKPPIGKKKDVHRLVRFKKWEQAAKYCDPVTYDLVMSNDDSFWKAIVNPIDHSKATVNDYGNVAMAIFHGSKMGRDTEVKLIISMLK